MLVEFPDNRDNPLGSILASVFPPKNPNSPRLGIPSFHTHATMTPKQNQNQANGAKEHSPPLQMSPRKDKAKDKAEWLQLMGKFHDRCHQDLDDLGDADLRALAFAAAYSRRPNAPEVASPACIRDRPERRYIVELFQKRAAAERFSNRHVDYGHPPDYAVCCGILHIADMELISRFKISLEKEYSTDLFKILKLGSKAWQVFFGICKFVLHLPAHIALDRYIACALVTGDSNYVLQSFRTTRPPI